MFLHRTDVLVSLIVNMHIDQMLVLPAIQKSLLRVLASNVLTSLQLRVLAETIQLCAISFNVNGLSHYVLW